jgi:hypothetical protein
MRGNKPYSEPELINGLINIKDRANGGLYTISQTANGPAIVESNTGYYHSLATLEKAIKHVKEIISFNE